MADDFMSDEDKALFRDSMRTVKPLNKNKNKVNTVAPKPTMPFKKQQKQEYCVKKEPYLSDTLVDTVFSETCLSYTQPSMSAQRFKALKNGQIPWESRLDLHGLNHETARHKLCQFIQTETCNNKRCLLIIHGKGGYSGAPPVIKNLLNRWLPQLNEVLAFHSALPKDGGNGAVYVLLKKKRAT